MRSGLLAREFITIYRYTNIQSTSGQIKKEKVKICDTRCYVKKQNGNHKEVAKELFDAVEINFQIRWNPNIQDSDIIEYNNQEFKITFINNNIWDRTMTLTAVKINK